MHVKVYTSLTAIGPAAWDRLQSPHYPFNDYRFLSALEESESIGAASGWQLAYFALEDEQGIRAVHPSYVKAHSYGEYIFDWEWARFYTQNRVPYYPKLTSALPFTPASGPRFLCRLDAEGNDRAVLLEAALATARRSEMSSYHALFLEEPEAELFVDHGCLLRHSLQYHWQNAGYRDFQDYLERFIGKRRRDIVRERRRAQSHGLSIQQLTGSALTPGLAASMEELYLSTIDKKDSFAYLRPGFFERLFAQLSANILLVGAFKGETLVAASLNLFKGEKLYGRYWGAVEPYPDLHFELCYYQTLDFAIVRNMRIFEAGAQGEHKIQRGFLPKIILSAHEIFDPRFRPALEAYVEAEKQHVAEAIQSLQSMNPFRDKEARESAGLGL